MDNPWADHHPDRDDGGGDDSSDDNGDNRSNDDDNDNDDNLGDTSDDSWKSGFDQRPDIAVLLALLLDPPPPPPIQFSTSATANAMNNALKLTRNLPASSASPLARFLTSKASLEWESAIKANRDVVPDIPHVGWRVLEKDQKKPSGGLLSFWNRKPPPLETPSSPPEPVRPSESASPSNQPPPSSPAPSAVSRFLNRFSRAKGPHHTSLALSSDDLEFLSDIVPSASDPPDQDIPRASTPSPLPPKLPPPPTRPSSTGVDPVTPTLAPPLSPKPPTLFPHPLSLKQVTTTSGIQQRHHPSPLLSLPPLLPPPPSSPPQTPRPNTFSVTTPRDSFAMSSTSFHDACDSDDEFSAFTSFPPSTPTPFPSQESPSPPSPPPRRTYERTHYPSSSSASSVQSPASHTSLDHLYSSKPPISASLDGFDDPPRNRSPSPPPLPVKPQRQPPRVDTVFPSRVYHAYTQSQTFAGSPTVHTNLMNTAPSPTSVSNAEHQRTQSLVDRAAARGGILWPNSPVLDEPKLVAIPPPPSASTSPKSLIGDEGFDLLGGFEPLPASLGMGSTVTGVLRTPFGFVDTPSKRLGSRHELQPSPPPLPSVSAPILSFSSLGARIPANRGPAQAAKTGGLSAQDISFFEGL